MSRPQKFPAPAPPIHVIGDATTADDSTDRFLKDVRAGLARNPKSIPSFYIYDSRGSELFRQIMELPEYYPTRTERAILEMHGASMAAPFRDTPCDVMDLGAGDGLKTRVLLEHLRDVGADLRYMPVDISRDAVESALEECAREQPWLKAEGVAAEYTDAIRWLAKQDSGRAKLVLFLGSNIGNMNQDIALRFFRNLRTALNPGDYLLAGFDLVKNPETLLRAYDDSQGVTREFNLNLLRRVNTELGADFDVDAFHHYACYASLEQRMESCLLSTKAQTVTLAGETFEFDPWEPLHTEVSCKYRRRDISAFASGAGFAELGHFSDERGWFIDALWKAADD